SPEERRLYLQGTYSSSTTDSSGQDQKAESAQEASREIPVDRKEQLPRQFQNLLTGFRGKLDRPRRVEVVQHFIAGISQGVQRCLLRKIMDVRIHFASFDQRPIAEQCLHRKVQRNVEYLVAAFQLQLSQEAEIVFKMLDHVQDENQVK